MSNILFYVFAACLGLILGSFAGCAAHRYLSGGSLVSPRRSVCPGCGEVIAWYDNIPVLSYLILRARCRHCGAGISVKYPLIELACGLWCLGLAMVFGPSPAFLVHTVFGTALVLASVIDFAIFILPDFITLPGALLAFLASWLVLGNGWESPLYGALAGSGLFFLLQRGYRLLRGAEGLGTGDVKLMLMLGALVGLAKLPMMITVGALSGLAASVFYLFRYREGVKTQVPFGPFLSLGYAGTVFISALFPWLN